MRSKGRSAHIAWRTRTSAPRWRGRRVPLQKQQTASAVPTTTTITTTCSLRRTSHRRLYMPSGRLLPATARDQLCQQFVVRHDQEDGPGLGVLGLSCRHTRRGLPWNRCLALIQNRQQAAENAVDVAQAKLLEDTVERGDGVGDIAVAAARAELDKLNKRIVADWWELNDELLVRFGDGWEYDWADDGTSLVRQPVPYPRDWLERNNFFRRGGGTARPTPQLLRRHREQVVDRGGKEKGEWARARTSGLSTWQRWQWLV